VSDTYVSNDYIPSSSAPSSLIVPLGLRSSPIACEINVDIIATRAPGIGLNNFAVALARPRDRVSEAKNASAIVLEIAGCRKRFS